MRTAAYECRDVGLSWLGALVELHQQHAAARHRVNDIMSVFGLAFRSLARARVNWVSVSLGVRGHCLIREYAREVRRLCTQTPSSIYR